MSSECLHSKIIHRTWKELNGEKIDRFLCATCGIEFVPKIELKPEKLMNDKIQMTEEQALDLFSHYYDHGEQYIKTNLIPKIKELGYILPNPVEIAEQAYNQINQEGSYLKQDYDEVINKLYKAVQHLKEK